MSLAALRSPAFLVVALAFVSVVAGCASAPRSLDEPPRAAAGPGSGAREIGLGERASGTLACGETVCEQWLRLRVPVPGELRIQALLDAGGEPPRGRLLLHDAAGAVLGQVSAEGRSSLRLERDVPAGEVALRLQIEGVRVSWEVVVLLAPAGAFR